MKPFLKENYVYVLWFFTDFHPIKEIYHTCIPSWKNVLLCQECNRKKQHFVLNDELWRVLTTKYIIPIFYLYNNIFFVKWTKKYDTTQLLKELTVSQSHIPINVRSATFWLSTHTVSNLQDLFTIFLCFYVDSDQRTRIIQKRWQKKTLFAFLCHFLYVRSATLFCC